nr:hypothetical protein BaRGS_017137 [Batillaria attramentaria]
MTSRNGNVRCCQQGYSMQSSNFMVNGRFINSCTCTRWLGNQVSGSVVMGDFNSTAFNQQMAAFGQRMNDWGTRFSASMNDWGQRLNNRMQSMGSRLRRMFSFY